MIDPQVRYEREAQLDEIADRILKEMGYPEWSDETHDQVYDMVAAEALPVTEHDYLIETIIDRLT